MAFEFKRNVFYRLTLHRLSTTEYIIWNYIDYSCLPANIII